MTEHHNYDGVQSLSNQIDGKKFSVGIFEPGEKTFTPDCFELVKVLKGILQVSGKTYGANESFQLEPGQSTQFVCDAPVAYLCEYSNEPFAN